jgi:hypothetical protein
MFGGLEHVDHELDLLIDSHVVVATSEKLDLLMRNSPEFAKRQDLIDASSILGRRPAAWAGRLTAVVASVLDAIGRRDTETVVRLVVPAADEVAALRTEAGGRSYSGELRPPRIRTAS